MARINSFNGFSQNLITKFINDNNLSSTPVIGEFNIYTSNALTTTVILPETDFYSVLPGAIIIANGETRYVLSKTLSTFSVTLSDTVNWYNGGTGYEYTYTNPILSILGEDQTIVGYLTSDQRLYITSSSLSNQISVDQVISPSTSLKLLTSNDQGLYIDSSGVVYTGNDATSVWTQMGTLSPSTTDLSDYNFVLDEDAMTSNSATNPASQQSVKAYVDNNVSVYTLPVASTSIGGVKSGTDITVDVSGNVSVNDDSHNHVISNVDGLQTALDGKTTESYVTTSISSLIDSSPATLNTLNELAAALGDDASFATTVTTSIGTKLTKTSNLSDLSSVTTARTNLGVDAAGTINYSISSDLLDEDAMTSNSATNPASQQSVKSYVDTKILSTNIAITDANDHYVGTNVESVFSEIGETRSINGYNLSDSNSMPDLSFNNTTRTFSTSVKSGQSSFHFWSDDKKIIKTTTQSVIITNTTGIYYILFDTSGTLIAVTHDAVTADDFYEHSITGLVYWNATTGTSMVGDERHGILMDAKTHHYNHSTFGARYESGININGLVNGNSTYTETTSGYFWDEDIRHMITLQSTHSFIYKLGATGEWNGTTADNNIGFKNSTSNVVYNQWTGSTWQLTESAASTDYIIYFFIATPDISGNTVKKIIGQNGYPNRNSARNAIETEINTLVIDGLPSPEFIFLYAYIVKRNGTLEDFEDDSTYLDLRSIKGSGVSNVSGISNISSDINTVITNFNTHLSATDTTIQLALETLDDHNHNDSTIDGGTW